jgi:hypothetical protein
MMIRKCTTAALLCAFLLALTGCKVRNLQSEYDMMKANHASTAELCAQAKRVTQAALESGKDDLYSQKKLQSDLDCATAQNELTH